MLTESARMIMRIKKGSGTAIGLQVRIVTEFCDFYCKVHARQLRRAQRVLSANRFNNACYLLVKRRRAAAACGQFCHKVNEEKKKIIGAQKQPEPHLQTN